MTSTLRAVDALDTVAKLESEVRSYCRLLDACFDRGLVIEASGGRDEVVKLLPPLTTSDEELAWGLEILSEAMASVLGA